MPGTYSSRRPSGSTGSSIPRTGAGGGNPPLTSRPPVGWPQPRVLPPTLPPVRRTGQELPNLSSGLPALGNNGGFTLAALGDRFAGAPGARRVGAGNAILNPVSQLGNPWQEMLARILGGR